MDAVSPFHESAPAWVVGLTNSGAVAPNAYAHDHHHDSSNPLKSLKNPCVRRVKCR